MNNFQISWFSLLFLFVSQRRCDIYDLKQPPASRSASTGIPTSSRARMLGSGPGTGLTGISTIPGRAPEKICPFYAYFTKTTLRFPRMIILTYCTYILKILLIFFFSIPKLRNICAIKFCVYLTYVWSITTHSKQTLSLVSLRLSRGWFRRSPLCRKRIKLKRCKAINQSLISIRLFKIKSIRYLRFY